MWTASSDALTIVLEFADICVSSHPCCLVVSCWSDILEHVFANVNLVLFCGALATVSLVVAMVVMAVMVGMVVMLVMALMVVMAMAGPCGFLFMRASPDWGNIAHCGSGSSAYTPSLTSTVG